MKTWEGHTARLVFLPGGRTLMLYIMICSTKFKPNIAECLDLLELEERGGEMYVGICLTVNVVKKMITSRYWRQIQSVIKEFLDYILENMGSLPNSANNQLWILANTCFKWVFFGILIVVQFSLCIFLMFDLFHFYNFNSHLWSTGFQCSKNWI